ncbi:MAG: biopolymer transporter ExbD [Drouetiella hepatica Uher 2000/2452]|jgi:biopolymer transport protein ExbD|uniref:Biopolymer transporter ExbD n=1 Tax=Drouetiella hepatica Uher 2000/2452 TaxID=904376 RepID=A0A951Q852_9CYAN|nr:biopolymer transporter ExbD [Drouetiella hepatica Uher 2000/2452]
MRTKNNRSHSQMPEINLIPMLDVLMTVLTFFIIVSMTLTGEQIFNVSLPTGQSEEDKQAEAKQAKLTIGLDKDGKTVMDNQPAVEQAVVQRVQKFLSENPEGIVTLKADKGLKYENVLGLLRTLRDLGGDRVFLAIEKG